MTFSKTRRAPIHVGTRVWTGGELGGKCICVFPLFRGEMVTSLRLDCIGMTKDDTVNYDQPPIFQWWGFYKTHELASADAITTAELDQYVDEIDETEGGGTFLGGELSSGAGIDAYVGQQEIRGYRPFLDRTRIGRPIAVGKDSLDNTDARFFDEFHTNFHMKFKVPANGMMILGAKSYNVAAQTDFGISELDQGIDPHELLGAYDSPIGSGGTSALAGELLYGGDNYIEADSYKNEDRRMYIIAKPHIKKNPTLGTN